TDCKPSGTGRGASSASGITFIADGNRSVTFVFPFAAIAIASRTEGNTESSRWMEIFQQKACFHSENPVELMFFPWVHYRFFVVFLLRTEIKIRFYFFISGQLLLCV